VEALYKRITTRGRGYERDIPRSYLEDVAEAYNHFFFHYSETPLLVVIILYNASTSACK
jgi:deoxyadenosine/deoxycytidine kinase